MVDVHHKNGQNTKWLHAGSSIEENSQLTGVKEVNNLVLTSLWYHKNGKNNPANLLSRGALPNRMTEYHGWKDCHD
ncbi:hypothetical protein CEXT_453471 [Caerostris extrusa]|uniref:HNH homing endonuclease n=1 Tax=Caerostris extrusa TaxID=172846 RepID=A0AAV4S712_CAEEX|nr:hypothetical protein CEXT_453471 [Caerostris extrusa]